MSTGATGRLFEVLRAVNKFGPVSVTDVSRALKLPYASCHRYINKLQNEGLVERCLPHRTYRPTALTLSLSSGYRASGSINEISRPYLIDLGQRVLWPVGVYTRVGLRMVISEHTSGNSPLAAFVTGPGHSFWIFPSASGAVYLASCDETERGSIFEALFKVRPNKEIHSLSPDRLKKHISKVRQQGYAISSPWRNGKPVRLSYLAVPLELPESKTAALALTYYTSAMSEPEAVHSFVPLMRDTADKIAMMAENV